VEHKGILKCGDLAVAIDDELAVAACGANDDARFFAGRIRPLPSQFDVDAQVEADGAVLKVVNRGIQPPVVREREPVLIDFKAGA
jgi:hypothetical protein